MTVNTSTLSQKIIFQINAFLLNVLFIDNPENMFLKKKKKIKQNYCFQHNNKKCLLSSRSAYYNDFWGIIWHCWKFSFVNTGKKYILKYIQIENSYFKIVMLFHNITVLSVFFIK